MSDVVVTYSSFASHPPSLAVCAPLWLYAHGMAALLYVQVEGEDPIGEEKLQEGDSVQTVVKRAVEGGDINPIIWKDVAGWKLLDSRAEKAEQLHSGTSSERLLKLLPFPDESLLLLTRRRAASTASASSSSPSAASSPSVQQIVDQYPPTGRQRDSYPLKSADQRMPRRVLMDDFPQYLPFVNRERQVADCVSHFAKAFAAAYDTQSGHDEMTDHSDEDVYGTLNPAQEAARKNYKMVIAAGDLV